MDWKDSFNRVTLLKGLQLYQDGQVGPVYKDGDIYVGNVGRNHLVEAQIQNGSIEQIRCSCPQAADGQLCSDEAAFLFALERSDLSRIPQKADTARQLGIKPAHHEPESEKWPGASTRKPENHFRQSPRTDFHPQEQRFHPQPDPLQDLITAARNVPIWKDTGSAAQPVPSNHPDSKPQANAGQRYILHREDLDHPSKPEAYSRPDPNRHPDLDNKSGDELGQLLGELFGYSPAASTSKQKPAFSEPVEKSHPKQETEFQRPQFSAQSPEPKEEPQTKAAGSSRFQHPEDASLDPFAFINDLFQQGDPEDSHRTKRSAEPLKNVSPKPEAGLSKSASHPFHASQPQQASVQSQPTDQAHPYSTPASEKAEKSAGPASCQKAVQSTRAAMLDGQDALAGQVESLNQNQPEHEMGPAIKPALTFAGLLDQISPAQLIKITKEYCAIHPEFEDFIIARCAENFPEEAFELLQEQALSKLKACFSHDGLFSPRQASLQAHSFCFWLADQVHALNEARQEARAISLVESVLVEMETGTTAEEENQIDIISGKAFELLETLARTANAPVKAELFSWIEEHLEKRDLPDFTRQLVRLVEQPCFNIEDLARLKLSCLIYILDSAQESRISYRAKAGIIKSALNLITDFPDLEQELKDFESRYGKNPEVMLEKARLALEHNETEKAEYLLKILRHERLSLHQEESICRLLIDLYQKTGQPELAVRELKELIFTLQSPMPSDLSTLHALESKEEWTDDLQRLEESADADLLVFVYDRLHLDDKLLSALEKECTIAQLAQYEERLAAVNPSRLAALWLKAARAESQQAQDRLGYRRTAAALQKAAQYKGTKDEAQALAQKIKSEHHRRHAFVQELERQGF